MVMHRLATILPGAALLALLGAGAAAASQQRPNILVLMAEDMGPRIGAYGDGTAHTPNLDRLAREGTRYRNTFATAGVCAPSRAAHILGMYQISTGTQHMRTSGGPLGSYRAVPPPAARAYPQLLRAAGYFTFTDNKLDYQFSGPLAGSGPFTIWDSEGGDAFAAWRQRADGQPFYGLVNFQATHESGVFTPLGTWPHSAMHFASQLWRAVQAPAAPVLPATDPARIELPPYYPDTATVRRDMARHYDNIAIMDWQVGEILAALRQDDLLDSTIVIWTSDHGDGLPRAKRELFDTGLRVPMIVSWPDRLRPPGNSPGAVEERLVSLVDFAPTLLRLAGVAVPPELHGRDFVAGAPRQYVYAARDRIDRIYDRQRAVGDGRFKYIRSWYPQQAGGHALAYRDNIDMMRELRALYDSGNLDAAQRQWFEPPGQERLFDTGADPFELHNLAADPAYGADLQRLRKALDAWLVTVGDWSEQPEAAMVAGFRPDGEQPVTPAPTVVHEGGVVRITAPEYASIGYRIEDAPWQLYTAPVAAAPGTSVSARAVRYGWEASDVVTLQLP